MAIIRNPDLLNYDYSYSPELASKPVLLLIHGLMGDLNNLGVIGRHFNKEFNVLKVDLVNHGKSFFREVMEYPLMVADIKKVLDHLGITQVIVVGHSMGGKVAMRFAFEHPEMVKELVVLDMSPVHYRGRRHDDVFAALRAVKEANATTREEVKRITAEYIDDPGVRAFILKSFAPEEDCKFIFNAPVLEAEYDHIGIWDPSVYMGPAAFIYGAESDYVNAELREMIPTQFPQAKFYAVESAGHWVHADQPKKMLNFMTEFLESEGELPADHQITRY